MNTICAVAAAFLGVTPSLLATSITIAGGPAPAQVPGLFDRFLNPLDGSFVSVGTFDINTSVFTQFVGTQDTLAIQTLFPGNPTLEAQGQATGTVTNNTDAAAAFNGQPIFIRVQSPDGAIAILGSDVISPPAGSGDPFIFPANSGGIGDAIVISPSQITIFPVGDVVLLIPGSIPEPSSALLIGSGFVLLGLRRRRVSSCCDLGE